MDKQNYFNSVTQQVLELKDLAAVQVEKCFDLQKLNEVLPPEIAGKIQRVIVTGCGDSYSAAGAMRPALRELSGIYDCSAPDVVDFCRYYTENRILKRHRPEEVLVISISFSGNSVRAAEALERAKNLGLYSLAITGNKASRCGEAAELVLDVETPQGCNTPGLRSYYASLVALSAVGAYLGLCRGKLTQERFAQIGAQIRDYTLEFMEHIGDIDTQMFETACVMKDLRKFETIADWNEGFSAQFVEQKLIECGGVFCDHTTSEEFAHISFFQRDPGSYGMIVMVNEADPSLSRMLDTVGGCLEQHRPTLVVTDAEPKQFEVEPRKVDTSVNIYGSAVLGANAMEHAIKPIVCRIPTAPERWMSPLVDFVPGALLAGYHAAVNERFFFDGRYDFRNQTWLGRN